MSSFTERLLAYYGLTLSQYQEYCADPSFDSLPRIDDFSSTKIALSRLEKAKKNNEKVLVYGDYDADGVMSASILVRSFREYGLDAMGYLPSRYKDGYGITPVNVSKIAKSGFSLIFTCDNGVTAYESLAVAKKLGVDVIILDHHELGLSPLSCVSLLHPSTLHYDAVSVSAGYLAFMFATALLKKIDPYLLCLAGISTLSDAMPLRTYNREIVRLTLKTLRQERYPEIVSLCEKNFLDENVLQMEIIPKINAVGRLEKGTTINRLLHYFAGDNASEKHVISLWLKQENEKRKALTKQAADSLSIDPSEEAIVVLASIPEGLNGLLASRLLSEFEKPVAVFSPLEKDPSLLVGSLRSKTGFNVLKALKGTKVPLISSGGHDFAGGVTIHKADFLQFKKDFLFAALKHKLEPKKEPLIPLGLEECTLKNYETIASFGPFGMDWPAPRFLLKNLDSSQFTYLKNGKYLSTSLAPNIRLFSFSIGADSFSDGENCNLEVQFSPHEYKGMLSLDLLAEKPL